MLRGAHERARGTLRAALALSERGRFRNSRAYVLVALGELALREAAAQPGPPRDGTAARRREGLRLICAGLRAAEAVRDAQCEWVALLRLGEATAGIQPTGLLRHRHHCKTLANVVRARDAAIPKQVVRRHVAVPGAHLV